MVSGPAIIDTYQILAAMAGKPFLPLDDRTIWQRGISGDDPLCLAAVDRFCMSLGSVAGDLALAHGAVGAAVAFAHEALQVEDKVGTMLPCNVIVQEVAPGRCEIAAIDPVASMSAIDNPALKAAAETVRQRLQSMVEAIS